ncbi:hypothetical protein CURTO8I2_70299 [Curtobacterium sp. 8I-2]|nr:hypothetical protein CURTO8I2_70299 [Curtobacterium sp. 8I-2]
MRSPCGLPGVRGGGPRAGCGRRRARWWRARLRRGGRSARWWRGRGASLAWRVSRPWPAWRPWLGSRPSPPEPPCCDAAVRGRLRARLRGRRDGTGAPPGSPGAVRVRVQSSWPPTILHDSVALYRPFRDLFVTESAGRGLITLCCRVPRAAPISTVEGKRRKDPHHGPNAARAVRNGRPVVGRRRAGRYPGTPARAPGRGRARRHRRRTDAGHRGRRPAGPRGDLGCRARRHRDPSPR